MEKLTERLGSMKTAAGIYTSMTEENKILRPESAAKVKGGKRKSAVEEAIDHEDLSWYEEYVRQKKEGKWGIKRTLEGRVRFRV